MQAMDAKFTPTVADGLPPEVAERTYRAMISAFEDYERLEWAKRQGK